MITVVASIKVAPGKRAEFLATFNAYATHVLTEKGCIEYLPSVDFPTDLPVQQTDDHVVTVVEKWQSLADLEAHLQAPAMQEFKENVKELLEGLTIKVLQPAT